LRGIAIGLVVFRHYIPPLLPTAGVVGVSIFFVLSGFLITGLLLGERSKTGQISVTNFYIRRMLRLLPALYFMLAVYLVAYFLWLDEYLETTPTVAVRGVLMSVFYVFNFGAAADLTPVELGPLWTLSVEEQFYFVWPLALAILLARGVRSPRLAGGLIAVIALAWLLRPVMWVLIGERIYHQPTTWMDALLLGALLAFARHHDLGARARAVALRTLTQLGCWAVLVVACATPELKSHGASYIFLLPVMTVAMGVVVLGAVEGGVPLISRVLTWRPLVWVGWISYSLYLWNFLVREALMATVTPNPWGALVLGVPISVLIAWGSRSLIETRAERYKYRLQRPVRQLSPQVS
jgi:peptidoglycan/LPS O-acetylase OafA/YrhL